MLTASVLGVVFLLALGVVAAAFRAHEGISREVDAVVTGIEERTRASDSSANKDEGGTGELGQLLDDAVQTESHQLAVFSVNELTGRVRMARSRATLLSRGLPRIALLSGGGGAFVLVAAGNFSRDSLKQATTSVVVGVVASFLVHGLTSSSRRHAKRYAGIVDVLARQVERHFSAERAE